MSDREPFCTEATVQQFYRDYGHYGWCAEQENWSRVNDMMLAEMPVSTDIDIGALPDSQGVGKWMQVEMQGGMGSCAGHARTSCVELAHFRQSKGGIIQLNRKFAYLSAQKRDGIWGDRGSTISGNLDAAREWGTCLEEIWPYTDTYPARGHEDIPQACWDRAGEFKIRSWKPLKNYAEVLAWLVHGIGGVDIGIRWNNSMEPDSRGCVERYYTTFRDGGHSVALLDWDKKFLDSKGRPYIDLFNSWSKRWGINGRCRVHPDIIDEWCANQTVAGVSDMVDIKPREFDWTEFWERKQ